MCRFAEPVAADVGGESAGGIMQRIFSSATAARDAWKAFEGDRRGGEQKILCTMSSET